ncbi:MAG: hypothetical protein SLRJCFUN_000888 [Candidatus Fervidibacter sp.]
MGNGADRSGGVKGSASRDLLDGRDPSDGVGAALSGATLIRPETLTDHKGDDCEGCGEG